MTILLWRRRFEPGRLAGLAETPRRFEHPPMADRDRMIALTLEPPPGGTTHYRIETFKFSIDPQLERVRDEVGLYLSPPERAIVLSVDEKTQIQALDRTQPMLLLRPGSVERRTHDYVRHGKTSLLAALNVATGELTQEAEPATTAVDFLAFLRRFDRTYPRGRSCTTSSTTSRRTNAGRRSVARAPSADHFHFILTSASWLNRSRPGSAS